MTARPAGAGQAPGGPAARPLAEADSAALLRQLHARHGPQGWWPARTDFEMMIGAVLVQNTAWRNAQTAVDRLEAAGLLQPRPLLESDPERLAALIRPAGFMTAKSRTCRDLARWVLEEAPALAEAPTPRVRESLLGLRGVGPETADVILLYAFGRPVFIADAYARRLLEARGFAVPGSYEGTRRELAGPVQRSGLGAAELGELHALIVAEGQAARTARPGGAAR